METPGKVSFALGVKVEERKLSVSVKEEEMVKDCVEMLSEISKKHDNRQTRRL